MESPITDWVLDSIADDYESIETILDAAHRSFDPGATADEVSAALEELVREGLAQTYELSPWPPHSKAVDLDLSRVGELWFYVTPKGKDLVRSRNSKS